MRKITFLVASFLLMLNATNAQENKTDGRGNNGYGHSNGNGYNYGNHHGHHNYYAVDYRDAEPIIFMERGIAFYVFPTGDFDFNIGNGNFLARRGGVQTSSIENRGIRGIRIEHDHFGRIRRIDNTFINYDYYGRVRRIGSVYMTYNSFALTRIGGMRLFYNFHGEIIGVNGFINSINYGYIYNPCPAGYNGYNNYNEDYNSDEDFYYYKKDGSKEKMKKEDIDAVKKDLVERKKVSL